MSTDFNSRDLVTIAVSAADAKKADDIIAIDLVGISDVCDAVVICTGANARLADSVVDEVEERIHAAFGLSPISIEGRADGRWILMDYGMVIVHVFSPEARDYYRIEHLWGDAPRFELALED